ncbi:MAG: hypothetical protein ACK58X_14110 [Planctomycetota bacterium]
MRKLAFLSLGLLAATASAQTLNTNLTPNNGGNVGGGLYFNLQVNTTLTITQLSMWTGGATVANANASFELWLGPSTYVGNVTNPSLWTRVGATASTVLTAAGQQLLPNLAVIPVPQIAAVTLAPGNYGFALRAVGCSQGYTNGIGTGCGATPGSCTNTLFSTPELVLRGGAAQNAFLGGGIFQPRMFSGAITYTVGGTPITFAQREPYGNGCYRKFRSFYELFPSSVQVDFNNTSMLLTYDSANNSYIATAGTTPVLAVTSPLLGHLDNNDIVVPLANSQPIIYPGVGGPGIVTTSVEMNSNGYVKLAGTAPSVNNPDVTAWLTSAAVRIGNHYDMDPSVVGGTTHYDYDTATSSHVFTWLNVATRGIAATSNTFQMAFFGNGNVEFRWGVMSVAGGGTWPTLVGFTPGNGAADPGSIDITASLPFATAGVDQPALALTSNANPVLGTTVDLTLANVTGANLGLTFLSLGNLGPLSPAGLDLGIIGAPGCVANIDLNSAVGFLVSNIPGLGTLTTPFAIPANQLALIGVQLYAQSAWLDATQNAAGLTTSNAVRLGIGSF